MLLPLQQELEEVIRLSVERVKERAEVSQPVLGFFFFANRDAPIEQFGQRRVTECTVEHRVDAGASHKEHVCCPYFGGLSLLCAATVVS